MNTNFENISALRKAASGKQLFVKCGQLPVLIKKSAINRALLGQKFYASAFATDRALYINSIQLY